MKKKIVMEKNKMNNDKKNSPNVLLITMDQWPGSFLGCEGHPVLTQKHY